MPVLIMATHVRMGLSVLCSLVHVHATHVNVLDATLEVTVKHVRENKNKFELIDRCWPTNLAKFAVNKQA